MEIKFNAGDMCAIPDGCRATIKDGVIIFEKGFEDGDVLHSVHDDLMLIYKESSSSERFSSHFNTIHSNDFGWNIHFFRYATEEEKQLLFDKMKEQGLRWNTEEKRVEKMRWRAKKGEYYFALGRTAFEVYCYTESFDEIDAKLYNCGNYFRTHRASQRGGKANEKSIAKVPRGNRRMKITELRIGDRVQEIDTRFLMVVVGLHSTLDDIEKGKGTVSLDFEGNEGDVWECEAEELERV